MYTHGFGPYGYGPPGYGYGAGPYGRGFGAYGGYGTGPYGHGGGHGPEDQQAHTFYAPRGLGWLAPPPQAPAAHHVAAHHAVAHGAMSPEEQMMAMIAASALLGMMFEVAMSRLSPACRSEMMQAMGAVSTQDIFDMLQREHVLPPEAAKMILDQHLLSTQPLMPQMAHASTGQDMGGSCCDQRQLKTWPLSHPQPMGQSCHNFMHGHGTVC